jgi:hypothetical protein
VRTFRLWLLLLLLAVDVLFVAVGADLLSDIHAQIVSVCS